LLGRYTLAGAKPIDADLVAAIIQIEGHLRCDDAWSVQPSKWRPAFDINPADVPEIPDFLRRAPADPPKITRAA
jgi:hypothetical protein